MIKDVKYAGFTSECSEFELGNRKILKVKTNITCRSRNIYYLKCKLCMYETYIGKTIGDHIPRFKIMNNHNTESRSWVSTCKFPIHVFNCIKRNHRQLEDPFFMWGTHLYMSLFPSVHPFVRHAPCLRNHTSSDHNYWCTYVK